MRAARHPAPARRPGFAFFSLTLLPPGFERWVEWPWVVDCGGRDLQQLRESVRPPHAQQDVLEYGAHAINPEPYDRVLVAVGDVAASLDLGPDGVKVHRAHPFGCPPLGLAGGGELLNGGGPGGRP